MVVSPYNDPTRTNAVSISRCQHVRVLRSCRGVTVCVSVTGGFESAAPLLVLAIGKDSNSGAGNTFGSASSINTSLLRTSLVWFKTHPAFGGPEERSPCQNRMAERQFVNQTEKQGVPGFLPKSRSENNLDFPFQPRTVKILIPNQCPLTSVSVFISPSWNTLL